MTNSTFSENQILYLLYALFISFLVFGGIQLRERKNISASYQTVKFVDADNDRKKHFLKRYKSQSHQKSWWSLLIKS